MWHTVSVVAIFFALFENCSGNCGFPSCAEISDDFLNVHIVPHSHDDVGWLKTVDQYYYGANNSIAIAGVQYIYDTTIEELWKDSQKKFVSVEMEFFSRWWYEQNAATRHKVTKLVQRGQLEFVGGGWCMNDEAAASYVDIIDQMTMGLKFLKSTFGDCGLPTAVWQIDPFGHSKEQASIFSQMGFEFLFLGRIDHQDKSRRLENREMEMVWKASNDLNVSLFTGVLYNTYSPPKGFCFDILCGDEPIVDDPKSPMYNINRRANELVKYIIEQSKHYVTNNIMLTMGEDFQYSDAHSWFKNLDKLIKYINRKYKDQRIRLFYSTPSCYGKAVQDSQPQLPEKRDDFFPYSSDAHAFWTGYFSSRSSLKGMVRQSSNLLQACKQLEVAQLSKAPPSTSLHSLQRSMAIAQHHDAVTGTAKQHVTDDYVLRLDQGNRQCQTVISKSYAELLRLPEASGTTLPPQFFCPLLNMSQCHVTEDSASFHVLLYNPLSFMVSHLVRFPVLGDAYSVVNGDGQPVPSQLVPIPESILSLPGRKSKSLFELTFRAVDLPPIGMKSFYVQRANTGSVMSAYFSKVRYHSLPRSQDVRVGLDDKLLRFDGQTGLLTEMTSVGDRIDLQQNLLQYYSMAGDNTRPETRASGAYIFRPNGTAEPVGQLKRLVTVSGPLITEVHQQFANGASQIWRLHHQESFIELDWMVGPIPVDDAVGKEVVTRFVTSQIRNGGIFFTDSNGREVLKRRLNYQPTYQVTVTEPVAGNYYPVNSFAYIEDGTAKRRFVVLNDRAQGAASLNDGMLEFMIHRRILFDDSFGVGEPLNETAYGLGLAVRGSHWLLATDKTDGSWRPLAQRKNNPPIVSFIPTVSTLGNWKKFFRTEFSLISHVLPENVKILSLEPWDEDRFLIRLEHFYGIGEDEAHSQPATVSIKKLFSTFPVSNIEEVNLSANRKVESRRDIVDGDVTLNPMEIRSLLLTIA